MNIKLVPFRTKIVGAIVLAGFLLALLLAVGIYVYLNNRLINEKIKEIGRFNVEQVRKNIAKLENDQQFVKLISERNRVSEYLLEPTEEKKAELLSIFSVYAQSDDKYLALYLLDKNGIAVISTDPTFVNQDYSFRNYYKEGMEGKGSVDILLGKTSNQFGYYFSYPVFDNDKNVIGIFVSKLANKEMDNSLSESNSVLDNSVMLVDEYGIVVFSNKDGRFLKSLGTLTDEEKLILADSNKFLNREILPLQYDIVQDSIRSKENYRSIKFKDVKDGEVEIIEIYKIGDFPFYLVSEVGLEAVGNTISNILFILVGIILFMVFLSAFFLYKMILIALNPLNKLKLFAKGVSTGNLSQRIDIKTKDEFGELADTFNLMSNNLQDLYDNLDKKVVEQTKEINDKQLAMATQQKAILNVLDDVEWEKKKTEKIAQDLEKFKLAVENATDHIVITDQEGIVIYGNKAVEKITGYKIKDIIGKKAGSKDLWGGLMKKEFYEQMWQTIKIKKEAFSGELINRRKSGDKYSALANIVPVLDEKKNILFFVGIEKDISEQKVAEEQISKVLNDLQEKSQASAEDKFKMESLLENIGDGIIVTDEDGRITIMNKSSQNMLGLDNEESLGKPVVEILRMYDENGKEVPLSKRPIVLAISSGEKNAIPQGKTYYYEKKDKTRFAVGITVTPFIWQKKIIGTIEVFRDITMEKNIDQAKTEFVSLASHQLRTPLTSINWNSEMLLAGDVGELSKEQKELTRTIHQSSIRMTELVDALLNVSRLELGTFLVEPKETEMVEMAEDVLEEMKVKIIEKKHKIIKKYNPNKILINADQKLLRMVFQNLLSNAIKYTPDKGTVSLKVEKQKEQFYIEVKDTGFGIPKADQNTIFTKLFRADNARKLEVEGTGLGLYIIKTIVEHAGGKIWFESTENKGTTFFVTFPLDGMKKKEGTKALA